NGKGHAGFASGLYLCRRRPESTPERSRRAPHTLACSTIGAAGIDATGITRCEVNSGRPWNTLRRLGAQKNSWCAPSYCQLYESGTGRLLRYYRFLRSFAPTGRQECTVQFISETTSARNTTIDRMMETAAGEVAPSCP